MMEKNKDYPAEEIEKEPDARRIIQLLKSASIIRSSVSEKEQQQLKASILRRIKASKRRSRRVVMYAAASIALLTLFTYLILSQQPATLLVGEKDHSGIQLILADSSAVSFEENTDINYDSNGALVVSGNGQKRLYAGQMPQQSVAMNKLIVPRGKQSSLTLPDGSRIWVNAGTTLEFPTLFAAHRREISVIGEIYIEVSKDEKRPFYLRTERFDINVTGTKFDVSAYAADPEQYVVLVEGAVEVKTTTERLTMRPNEQFKLSGDRTSLQAVADVSNYTAWKDHLLVFSNESLRNALSRLSRYYNLRILCHSDICNIRLSGKLYLFEDYHTVLQNIETIIPVKYTTDGEQTMTFSRK
jgi:ferric-dicitrate binding protein FerR (iron transport regulator)